GALALLLVLCDCSPSRSNQSTPTGRDGGPDDDMPVAMQPARPQPDAGPSARPSDTPDAGHDAAVVEPMPNFVLQREQPPAAQAAGDPRAEWQSERRAHGPLGYAGSFALEGASYRLTGRADTGELQAPFALHMNGNSQGLIGFEHAEVEGIDETGRV